MSKGEKEWEDWLYKRSIFQRILILWGTISAHMNVVYVWLFIQIKEVIWPTHRAKSIKQIWLVEWHVRRETLRSLLKLTKKSRNYELWRLASRYIDSKNSRMRRRIIKAFYSKFNILKFSQIPNLNIDSCQHMSKNYKPLTITSNTFSSLQSLMLPLPLKSQIWNWTRVKESSIKVGIVKGRSSLCAWHSRSDYLLRMG